MAGVYGDIDSRKDFISVLDKATSDGRTLVAQRLGDATIEAILRQLEAVATWSANGRTPTKDERESIDIAVRASREFGDDPQTFAWTRALYALDAYIEDWPSDEDAASATDDDFFDDDDD